jgi:hypothetical protein
MTLHADLITTIKNRLISQGFVPTDEQVASLVIDIENTINADASTALAAAAADVVALPVPPENE